MADQQIVIVPGLGEVRFDDTVADAEVLRVIHQLIAPQPQPRRRYYDPQADQLTTRDPRV